MCTVTKECVIEYNSVADLFIYLFIFNSSWTTMEFFGKEKQDK